MINQKILTFRCYRKKYNFKKIIKFISIFMFFTLFIFFPNRVLAETEEEIMNSTQEKFNISGFIKEAQNYTGDFLEDIDLNNILNQAIQGKVDNKTIFQKILKLLGTEINTSLRTLISILVIIVIHGILKSITDSLENKNISQIIYFVQYILIVTLIMSNFTEIINLVKNTANDLVGFINMLMPLLLTLMIYTGSIATSSVLEPVILFAINLIGNLIKDILIVDFDDFWTYDVLQEELNNPNSEYFVAKLENNILGFAGIWKSVDDVHITDIVVKKILRKSGIGSKLLEKLIQTAKDENFKAITLEVSENNLPAINLYLKYGFKKVGFRKKYYNHKDNAIIMTKDF